MTAKFADATADARPLYVVSEAEADAWIADQSAEHQNWLRLNGFHGKLGQYQLLPAADGGVEAVVAGFGSSQSRARGRFHLAAIAPKLPSGSYQLDAPNLDQDTVSNEALGWLLSQYRFDRYAGPSGHSAHLIAPAGVNAVRVQAIAAGEVLGRDLINTPANDMGPAELERAARSLAKEFGASIEVIGGDDLLERRFPMIHAVGRASVDHPRLIDMRWGTSGPTVTLVGKGVCFDTGGLNLKPGQSMGMMKKDMGGAATVLALTQMIMSLALPVQLRVLIPAVENSVSAASNRPGDILTARNGLTVEINNTDAEGRLVLADALAYAAEEAPEYLFSIATLTGAARVALGPDVVPFYTDDDVLAEALQAAASGVADPLWRMPFWQPYEAMIEPGIADLDNAPSGGFAGSITAALLLRRFVGDGRYAHFDIYGWQPSSAPARPKGGVVQAARAILSVLS